MVKLVKFKDTDDDWYPSHPKDQVKVICHLNMDNNGQIWHRISVWGDDDFGMEKDFEGKDMVKDVEALYRMITSWSKVNQMALKNLGFVQA